MNNTDQNKVLVKRIEMALHVQELCANHKIQVIYQPLKDATPRYYANQKTRTICIRPTKNTGFYVSALHEIGHILGKFQDRSLLTKELWAWVWAREHSLVWTDTADRIMRRAMDSYGWGDVQKNRWKELFNE